MVNRLQIAADQIDHKSSGNNRGDLTGNVSTRSLHDQNITGILGKGQL